LRGNSFFDGLLTHELGPAIEPCRPPRGYRGSQHVVRDGRAPLVAHLEIGHWIGLPGHRAPANRD
jgi:hypothetical protein